MLYQLHHLGVSSSLGRMYPENIKYNFLEDKIKIIGTKAFRRLEYKTQVFINYTGDHYRTRLTHSLEVSQIAIYIAKELKLNEELVDVIALSHDIGHPPFGHAGEDALNIVSKKFGGFNHNLHAIKIVTKLEKTCAHYDGLNLTLDTIDGLLKHNGPISNDNQQSKFRKILLNYPIILSKHSSLEAQVAALADEITYIKHDIDDGIRANFINIIDLQQLNITKLFDIETIIKNDFLSQEIKLKTILSNINDCLIKDLLNQTIINIQEYNINCIDDIYNSTKYIVAFSKQLQKDLLELKAFLFKNVYKNYKVNRIALKTKSIITDLFHYFIDHPKSLHELSQQGNTTCSDELLVEYVINYIAGMTDRFAVEEHKRIFDPYHY